LDKRVREEEENFKDIYTSIPREKGEVDCLKQPTAPFSAYWSKIILLQQAGGYIDQGLQSDSDLMPYTVENSLRPNHREK
jgi:hypothetical protein